MKHEGLIKVIRSPIGIFIRQMAYFLQNARTKLVIFFDVHGIFIIMTIIGYDLDF